MAGNSHNICTIDLYNSKNVLNHLEDTSCC
jgi:hypothetical protein